MGFPEVAGHVEAQNRPIWAFIVRLPSAQLPFTGTRSEGLGDDHVAHIGMAYPWQQRTSPGGVRPNPPEPPLKPLAGLPGTQLYPEPWLTIALFGN